MKYSAIFSHASRLRESGNRFILAELEKAGLGDIVPSHGDILVRLLSCEACSWNGTGMYCVCRILRIHGGYWYA